MGFRQFISFQDQRIRLSFLTAYRFLAHECRRLYQRVLACARLYLKALLQRKFPSQYLTRRLKKARRRRLMIDFGRSASLSMPAHTGRHSLRLIGFTCVFISRWCAAWIIRDIYRHGHMMRMTTMKAAWCLLLLSALDSRECDWHVRAQQQHQPRHHIYTAFRCRELYDSWKWCYATCHGIFAFAIIIAQEGAIFIFAAWAFRRHALGAKRQIIEASDDAAHYFHFSLVLLTLDWRAPFHMMTEEKMSLMLFSCFCRRRHCRQIIE